jgi:uncharacterized protein (DUF305 family)
MKNFLITAAVLTATMLTALFSAGRLANTVTGADDKSQKQLTCTQDLKRTMDEMHMEMHQVKTTGDVDEDFVRLMLPHHRGAVEMAKVELLCGKDPVNRRLAQEIIVEQQSEIDLMNLWLSKRDAPKPQNHTEHRMEEKKP